MRIYCTQSSVDYTILQHVYTVEALVLTCNCQMVSLFSTVKGYPFPSGSDGLGLLGVVVVSSRYSTGSGGAQFSNLTAILSFRLNHNAHYTMQYTLTV